jgi:antitoxin CptB
MSDLAHRFDRARFRAWHRGTREADLLLGGFFDHHHSGWDESALAWFEALLEEDDVEVIAWALSAWPAPAKFRGEQLTALQRLDYVTI